MQVVLYAVAFLFYVILARLLSPADIGSLSLLLSVMAVYNTWTMLALNNAATKLISEHSSKGEDGLASSAAKDIFRLTMVISVPSPLRFLCSLDCLGGVAGVGFFWSCAAILSAGFVTNLTLYFGSVMYGLSLFEQIAYQSIIFNLFSRLPALFLAYLGLGVFGVASGYLVGSVICLVFSLLILRGKLKRTGKDCSCFRKIVSFSLPIYVNNMLVLAQGWA